MKMHSPTSPMETSLSGRSPVFGLGNIVEELGTDRFALELLSFLHRTCGADHCAIYQLSPDSLKQMFVGSFEGGNAVRDEAFRYIDSQYWRRDPAMCEARSRVHTKEPVVIRVDIDDLVDSDLRNAIFPHISGRLFVAGHRREAAYGLSILRSDAKDTYDDCDVDRVSSIADLLVSLLVKHADLALRRNTATFSLKSLAEIENCLVAMTQLPRREVEVCARILHGISTAAIALDLAVGEESVKSYRKRAYQKLGIGTERDLLNWYIGLWGNWTSCGLHEACGLRLSDFPVGLATL
jgi:DNA-binding CsgD family transcriptional regulator